MMVATNNGVGLDLGFPDTCLTPPVPVPIPYPNIALHAQTTGFSPNIYTGFLNALHLASLQPTTMAMEAGSVHPLFKQMGRYTMGNPCIFVNCLPAIHLVCPTTGNAMNNPVGVVTAPSVTVTLYTDAAGPDAGTLDGEGLTALDRATQTEALAVEDHGEVRVVMLRRFGRALRTRMFNALRGHAGPVVIDLRGCPGGDAEVAFDLADDFVDRGVALAVRVEGDRRRELRARRGPRHTMPLALLTDRRTASAAELFALALRGRARRFGETSAGKSTGQRVVRDADGTPRYTTVARFEGPDGLRFEDGLAPDVADVAPLAGAIAALTSS